MSNDYFEKDDYEITSGTRARASQINTALDAIETGFETLPSESRIKRGIINYASDTGSADAYIVALTYTPSAYLDGMQVIFKASGTNTGACTINVNSLGAKSILRHDGSTPVAGDITASRITELRYNETSDTFELQGSIGGVSGSGTMSNQNASLVSITGGAITGITDLAIADGGTGASNAAGAVSNFGLSTATLLNAAASFIDSLTVSYTQVNAAAEFVDDLSATTSEVNQSADGVGVSIPRQKIVEIGDWNMDTTAEVTVPHGLTLSKIVGARCLIRNDANDEKFVASGVTDAAGYDLRIEYFDSTNVYLQREGSGQFDSTSFDSTSYNRGWVIIDYIN